jgi:H+-transporting ATPase
MVSYHTLDTKGLMTTLSNPTTLTGLSTQEAQQRLQTYGPNAVPEEHPHRWLIFLHKMGGPVPWMLELATILEMVMGKYVNAVVTMVLVLLNATLSFIQENRAQNALALLRQRLTIQSRVMRDGRWQLIPAQDLVPGDLIRVRVGDMVPADVRLLGGELSADQSALTGESLSVDIGPGATAYAGSTVQRGEAAGEVSATGQHTYFGHTAELVHTAKTVSHLESIIANIVKYLVAMNLILVAAILIYGVTTSLQWSLLLPFILILLVASVPVALPATFTLATALGSLELSRRGVVVTRLSAITESAGMDVLCSDKTGTITKNQLALADSHAYPPYTQEELLRLAALVSDDATQDPIDLAILQGAADRQISVDMAQRVDFTPFDPMTKRTEALVRQNGHDLRVVKGFPQAVMAMTANGVDPTPDLDSLAAGGYRVLAVAAGQNGDLRLAGLVALQDPPRDDSKTVVQRLRDLGVRVLMITGDSLATAQAIARQVGITGEACSADAVHQGRHDSTECEVFAGVFPEDKFQLVKNLQQAGHVVGMTGDGVNDAPALKQAEVGVAVANATDVAKAAASLVLTNPGLSDMLAAVEVGRRIYQRMLTYTLNKIVKTFQIGLFLSLGLLLFGDFVTRPRLILLLLFANDFVTMSLATDRVSFSPHPDRWNIRSLVVSALVVASAWLVFSFGTFLVGRDVLNLDLGQLRTLVFLMLVFSGQANVYLVRERRHLWSSRPSRWLMLGTTFDVIAVSLLATQGILMVGIQPALVGGILLATVLYTLGLDVVKTAAWTRLSKLSNAPLSLSEQDDCPQESVAAAQ